MITAKELLKKINKHDQPILDFLMVDRNEMTTIQLANHFKRARSDMKMTVERLRIGGHIKQAKYNYGKWHAVNYDYSYEIAAKRPGEAVDKIKLMTDEIAELREALQRLVNIEHERGGSLGVNGQFYYKVPESIFKDSKQLLSK